MWRFPDEYATTLIWSYMYASSQRLCVKWRCAYMYRGNLGNAPRNTSLDYREISSVLRGDGARENEFRGVKRADRATRPRHASGAGDAGA